MRDKVISIFCLVDDILQGIRHEEDKRRKVSDSEVLTTVLVSADSAYTDYRIEDALKKEKSLLLKIQRKGNSKRPDSIIETLEKLRMRKRVETTISDVKKLFPKTIHVVTFNGFLLKLICFVCVEQLNHFFN